MRGRNHYPQDIEATAEAAGGAGVLRGGCSAAFAVPTKRGGEALTLVAEVRRSPQPPPRLDGVVGVAA